jgi:hypothetical protein
MANQVQIPVVCLSCRKPDILYWLKDTVWHTIAVVSQDLVWQGHLFMCLGCAERRLGRLLTLHDLDVGNYARTEMMPRDFMRDYTRATLYGACEIAQIPPYTTWQFPTDPHVPAMDIGRKLASRTADARDILPILIVEAERQFA